MYNCYYLFCACLTGRSSRRRSWEWWKVIVGRNDAMCQWCLCSRLFRGGGPCVYFWRLLQSFQNVMLSFIHARFCITPPFWWSRIFRIFSFSITVFRRDDGGRWCSDSSRNCSNRREDDAVSAARTEVTVSTEVVGSVKSPRSETDEAFRPQTSSMTLKNSHCWRPLPVLFLLSRIFLYLIIGQKAHITFYYRLSSTIHYFLAHRNYCDYHPLYILWLTYLLRSYWLIISISVSNT